MLQEKPSAESSYPGPRSVRESSGTVHSRRIDVWKTYKIKTMFVPTRFAVKGLLVVLYIRGLVAGSAAGIVSYRRRD